MEPSVVLLYAGLAFIVIFPIVWFFVKGRVHAKAKQLGDAAGLNLEDKALASLAKGLERDAAIMGARLRFPNAAAGRAVVEDAMLAAKTATAGGDGVWRISHGVPDMVTATWRVEPDGSGVLLAARTREALGGLVTTRTWTKLLEQVGRLAAERGVPVGAETVPVVKTEERIEGDAIWVAGS